MTKGVEVDLVGGGREGRARADPRGSEGARSQRPPWRGDLTGGAAVLGTEPSSPLDAPRAERSAEETRTRIGGTCCASWVGDMAEALLRLSRPRSPKGTERRERSDRVADPDEDRGRATRCFGPERHQDNRSRGLVEWA
jgi:hypothetical protein